ncbi:MAG: MFS transporter [Candidatus Tectomicrobia bacterium]|nr:MFS transporter [Candidatus Tectomicrobia bacterium]
MMASPSRPKIYHGWIIVFISFVTLVIGSSAYTSFSVFYVALLEEFHWFRADTAGAFSLHMIVFCVAAPFIGWAIDRFGPRIVMPLGVTVLAIGLGLNSQVAQIWHLYVTVGIIMTIGSACIMTIPHTAILANWFVKKRTTATGIVFSGLGVGGLLIAPLSQYLISHIGWRASYLIIASAIFLILVPLIAIFQRHRPQDMGLLPDGDLPEVLPLNQDVRHIVENDPPLHNWTPRTALKTYRFWALIGYFLCLSIKRNTLEVHQVAYLVDKGYGKLFAASIVGIVNIISSVGSIGGGVIADRRGKEQAFLWITALEVVGIVLLATLTGPPHTSQLYLSALLFGLGSGASSSIGLAATADIFHGRHFATIYAMTNIGYGLGGAFGPWFGGYVYDRLGSYGWMFIMVMLGSIFSCLAIWIAGPTRREARELRVEG